MRALIGGRMGRRRYWTWVGATVMVAALLATATRAPAGVLAMVLWLCAAIPRLHDHGRSGWWAAGVVVFIAGAVGASATVGPLMVAPMAFLGVLLELTLIVWLGLAEPDPGENRWGPPVERGEARTLASRGA